MELLVLQGHVVEGYQRLVTGKILETSYVNLDFIVNIYSFVVSIESCVLWNICERILNCSFENKHIFILAKST
jgi:hypothetical protein